MSSTQILVVCTANICRSPVGVALLQSVLKDPGSVVRGAGTLAVVGHPPVAEAIDYVYRTTGGELSGRAKQLELSDIDAADLILTMTQRQRSEVAQMAPSAMRRSFTLREFVRISSLLPSAQTYPSTQKLTAALVGCRSLAGPAVGNADNVIDPYGAAPAVYKASFDLIAEAAVEVGEVLNNRISTSGTQVTSLT